MEVGLEQTKAEYNPLDNNTHKYYWPVDNNDIWKEGVHYSWSNAEFKNKLQTLIDFNAANINSVKQNGAGTNGETFDRILENHYYLYGKMKEDIKFWKDNEGNMDSEHPWVKICWSDFKKIMKKTYADNVSFTKEGLLEINDTVKNKICISVGDKNQCCVDGKSLSFCKGSILTNTLDGDEIPLILNEMLGANGVTNTYITQEMYEHLLFPFWRLLSVDFYIKNKWTLYIANRRYDNIAYKMTVQRGDKTYYLTEDRGYTQMTNGKFAVLKPSNSKTSSRIRFSFKENIANDGDYYYFKLGNKFLSWNSSRDVLWINSQPVEGVKRVESNGKYKLVTPSGYVLCFKSNMSSDGYCSSCDLVPCGQCQMGCKNINERCSSNNCPGECGTCKGVLLYQHDSFGGRKGVLKHGNHNISTIRRILGNDELSSLIVPKNCQVTLYQHGGFRGYAKKFEHGHYNLSALRARGVKNDDVSSAVVRNSNLCPNDLGLKPTYCNNKNDIISLVFLSNSSAKDSEICYFNFQEI